ncbi:MAG TPA: septum site-determining protein MinC [Promineifilum sp.]
MTRQIEIKGIRDGLLIRLDDKPDAAVYERLRRELEQKRDFLQGSRIAVEVGRRAMNAEQLAGLQELFTIHELELWAVLSENRDTRDRARNLGLATRLSGSDTDLDGEALARKPVAAAKLVESGAAKQPPEANALLLRETLRSGRSVLHDGHVVVLGDVNPGAEVVATGNVIVWGRLRGLVHAGSAGDESAVICALDLSPTQLRIADRIAVAPEDTRNGAIPELAAIRDEQIVAEPWRHAAVNG